jgi:hypothetical protein
VVALVLFTTLAIGAWWSQDTRKAGRGVDAPRAEQQSFRKQRRHR